MTMNRNSLRYQLMAICFSMWDLHLYLDTHPCDSTAAELLEKYSMKYDAVKADYEKNFGPLTPKTGHGEKWLQGPWPWERECN